MKSMIKAFFLSFVSGLLLTSIAHNYYQMNKSLAHCEQIVQEIHQKAENLKNL